MVPLTVVVELPAFVTLPATDDFLQLIEPIGGCSSVVPSASALISVPTPRTDPPAPVNWVAEEVLTPKAIRAKVAKRAVLRVHSFKFFMFSPLEKETLGT
jgi:hypothetical protein